MKENITLTSLTELKSVVDRLLAENGDMTVSIINSKEGPKMIIEKDCVAKQKLYNLRKK